MTYIEFYDKNAIENLCACLSLLPDEVILVGNDEVALQRHIKNYQKIFDGRKQSVKFSYKTISNWKVRKVMHVLEEIVEKNDDCVFGITGGDELVVFALGILCERYANTDKSIQVHKISIQNNKVYDCDMDGETIDYHTPVLSVEENIQIYGGEIVYEDSYGEKTNRWDMTPEFEQDIETIWSICKQNPENWNRQVNVYDAILNVGVLSGDGRTVKANAADVRDYCKDRHWRYVMNTDVKEQLVEAKLVEPFDTEGEYISITFKSSQVRKCFSQAGLALEMKTYKTARNLVDDNKMPLYNDAMNGVEIDWDGIIPEADGVYDTTNEIDVMLMHHMVPIFVSCKNGRFTADEFYKLTTVAERFGGKYAKRVLVSSCLKDSPSDRLLKQRAKDMGIEIISGEDLMDDELLAKRLGEVWR